MPDESVNESQTKKGTTLSRHFANTNRNCLKPYHYICETSHLMCNVSVVIPTYNRARLVTQTIKNVLSQSLRPSQVIVVDDGSTDETIPLLKEDFGSSITLITQQNQGPGAARNKGLEIATGEFVWLMDSDDLSSLNKLETQVESLKKHSADVVYSPWARVFFNDKSVRLDGPVLQQRPVPSERSVLAWFMTDWSLVFQHCLFRRSILQRAGMYRTDIWTCDDSEYFVRILCQDAKVIFDDRSITLYRSDDHGKVTGTGFTNSRRLTDWAKCLIAMHDQYPDANRWPQHHMRMWQANQELRKHMPSERELASELASRIRGGGFPLRSATRRIYRALEVRLRKTHWSRAYQTGELTDPQSLLINELGYAVA